MMFGQCDICKNLINYYYCKAFPKGIPKEYSGSSGDSVADKEIYHIENECKVHSKIDPRQEGNYIFESRINQS